MARKRTAARPPWLVTLTLALLTVAACAAPTAGAADADVLFLQTYSVRDLVFPAASDQPAYVALDDLVVNVREASGVNWDQPGYAIQSEDSGFMVVRASPAAHKNVATVLTDMRRFAAKPR